MASGIDTIVDKQQVPLSEIERKELGLGLTKRKLEPLLLKSLDLKVNTDLVLVSLRCYKS